MSTEETNNEQDFNLKMKSHYENYDKPVEPKGLEF